MHHFRQVAIMLPFFSLVFRNKQRHSTPIYLFINVHRTPTSFLNMFPFPNVPKNVRNVAQLLYQNAKLLFVQNVVPENLTVEYLQPWQT